ncbi:SNF3 [Candida theae]|uniref:SNF3 n=1 Tax=Candida theae TaxID=1198502 RepID=A0AAD5FVL6_9ASCO|nr:SNF3 [Candida theae]KAI5948684.1 SNF3 [Candida theae]
MKLSTYIGQIWYDNTIEEEYYRKMRQKSSSNSAFFVGLVAAVGGFMYGYDTGLINDLLEMHFVYTHFPSNHIGFATHERAIVVASLSLGTFFGALVAPLISDNYGRKFSIIISAGIIFNIGNVLQICSTEIALLSVGRFVSGISVGILSAIVPLYQAEASPKWVRGSVVFTYQWAITWGLLIASAVCQGTRKITNSGSYRIPVGIQFLWALVLSTGMLFLPESPRYYVQKDNLEKALDSLCKLRRLPEDDECLIEELVEIKANFDYERSFGKTTILDCFRSGGGRHKQRLRMFTGIGVQFFQQCSGVNFIFYYGVNFFNSAGVKNYYIMSLITYIVNVVFTVPGIILIDTVGRRPLLFWGGIGMAASNFIIAITGVSVKEAHVSASLCVSFSCVFILFFASTWGGCAWALCSDIYGISIRQKGVALTAATNWLVNFVFAYITPYLIDTGSHTVRLGGKIFFIWGSLNALGTVFVYFTVYETKGLKLEEVDYMYAHCANARVSKKFKSTKINYAELDGNYNLIDNPQLHQPASTTSNELTPTEKDNDEDLLIHHDFDDATSHFNAPPKSKHTTTSTHRYERTPSSSNDSEDRVHGMNQRKQSMASNGISSIYSTKSGAAATAAASNVSNDYQEYLESLKREYSQHYSNSANIVRKVTSSIHNSSSIYNGYNSRDDDLGYLPGEGQSQLQQQQQPQPQPQSQSQSQLHHGTLNYSGDVNELNRLPTTIIAAPFFEQPPSDSDSDSDSESD